MYKIGIAGTGHIANVHVKSINKIKKLKLVGVYSHSKERAEKFARKFGIETYDDYDDLLDNIDIIDITSKNSDHYPQILEAVNKGKKVIVEKPITLTAKDAKIIAKECANKNIKLTVISQHRYNKTTKILKEFIANGRLGNIFLAKASFKWSRNQSYYDARPWRKSKLEGGLILNAMIHFIDLLTYLFGDVNDVYCKVKSVKNLGVEDSAIALLSFNNGVMCEIDGTTSTVSNMPNKIEVHGTKGSLGFSAENFSEWYLTPGKIRNRLISYFRSYKLEKKGKIKDQIRDFVDCLEQNRKPESNEQAALKVMEVISALHESAKMNKKVDVKYD